MADTPNTTPANVSGISTPPNGGTVDDTGINPPNDNGGSTIPQASAPNTPPPVQTPQTPTAGQSPSNQTQPTGPQGPVDLSKTPKGVPPATPGGAPQVPQVPPVVKKASVFHDVAEALAGGPRFTYSVDAYGNMQKQPVPVSTAHLGLAIAMEALSGAATGFAHGQGPAGAANAVGASFAQGQQQVQDQDAQAKKQATDDFARRAQVTETNMRMYASARALGKEDAETIDSYINQYKDLATKLQTDYKGFVKGFAKYSDLAKYNATVDTAIPYMRVPRIDPTTGKQVETNSVPQWDIDYMILDPNFKAAGLISPDALKTLHKWGADWAANENVGNTPMNAMLSLNKVSQAAHLGVAESTLDKYWKTLDTAHSSGAVGTGFDVDKLNNIVDSAAKDAKVNPSLIRAVIEQESEGNPNAVSPTGATGLMQLTGSIAKQFGVEDRTNPEQNVKAGTQLFSQLLNQFKDPRLAYAAYYSGPGAIQNGQIVNTAAHTAADTAKQADHFMQILTNGPKFAKAPTAISPNDVKDAVSKHMSIDDWVKGNPTAASDMEKFMGALNGSDGSYSVAMQHLISSGQGDTAGKVAQLLGGPDMIRQHDEYVKTQDETQKAAVQTEAIEKRATDAAARKQATQTAVQDHKTAMIQSLMNAKIPDDALQMSDKDVVQNLQDQGVTLPLQAIIDAKQAANYGAPLTIASNKKWYLDSGLDQSELLSIVKMFNPNYDSTHFDSLRAQTMPNSPPMKTITSASQLANHLNIMQKIINQQSGDKTPIPLLNKFLQTLGYQSGGTQLTDLNTISNIVTSELGKSLAGGFAPDKEQIAQIIKTMNPANATQQMNQILNLYVDAMRGKVGPLDEEYNQMSGAADKHLPIPKSLNDLFQSRGIDTPWAPKQNQQPNQPQQVPGQRPNETPVYVGGKVVGFTMQGKTGMRPVTPQQ
jgi:hypothetical protein